MDPRLLIVAIYAPSENNAAWYRLQSRFIAKTTTSDYAFNVFLNGVDATALPGADVLASFPTNHGHARALAEVLDHLRRHPHSAYLILDSDCFPVAVGWQAVLIEQMRRFGKRIAAPVRAENLDLFPHPSALFFLPEALQSEALDFRRERRSKNLLGESVNDVGSAMADLGDLLPMMRTNARNVHPVAAAIYHHLFYHHGAGSRDFAFRVVRRFAYCDHWYDRGASEAHQRELLAALLADPDRFVKSLMGYDEPLLRGHLRQGSE